MSDSEPRHQDEKEAPFSDNAALKRFEIAVDGQIAFLVYQRADERLILIHTEVPEALRGRHFGDRLVAGALQVAQVEGLRIVAVCPFARAYLRKRGDRTVAPPT
jgi:predicted GNAT family acetyltransferase